MIQKRQDYFLLHPPRQPKREIARYAWQNGVLVPDIFTSFKYAKIATRAGIRVRARSEHPQDYFGVSGLLDSPMLNDIPQIKNERELKDEMRYGKLIEIKPFDIQYAGRDILVDGKYVPDPTFVKEEPAKKFKREMTESTQNVLNYFAVLNLPPQAQDEFWKHASFSYWKDLDGYNLTITADSAIAGRYHVSVRSHSFCGYLIFEGGKATYQSANAPTEIIKNGRAMAEFYEEVRNLPKFDPNICPSIEAQLCNNTLWFLQYLRGQPFSQAAFRLERPPGKNELVAKFVRGATVPGGELYVVKLYEKRQQPRLLPSPYAYPDKVDGAFDISPNSIFRELSLRLWQVNIMFEQYDLNATFREAVTHEWISRFFKPKISLILDNRELEVMNLVRHKKNNEALVWLESDGNKAYLRIL